MPRVLPCPFCGADNVTNDASTSTVFCNVCHAEGGLQGLTSWNERSFESAAMVMMQFLRDQKIPEGAGSMFARRIDRISDGRTLGADEALRSVLAEAVFCITKRMNAEDTARPRVEAARDPALELQ
ncbi:MAG: hypothetical protein AAF334_05095 [Pseudomonadota bacterium]